MNIFAKPYLQLLLLLLVLPFLLSVDSADTFSNSELISTIYDFQEIINSDKLPSGKDYESLFSAESEREYNFECRRCIDSGKIPCNGSTCIDNADYDKSYFLIWLKSKDGPIFNNHKPGKIKIFVYNPSITQVCDDCEICICADTIIVTDYGKTIKCQFILVKDKAYAGGLGKIVRIQFNGIEIDQLISEYLKLPQDSSFYDNSKKH